MATVCEEKYIKSIKGVMLSSNLEGTEAYLKLVSAELSGEPLTTERIFGLLTDAGVTYGVRTEAIEDLAAKPVYNERILVASGDPPSVGKDAELEYLFDSAAKHEPTVDQTGRVDYKNLNYIQNAKAGQILVRKNPPVAGTPGKSVFGKEILPRSGRDKAILRGANTESAPDGLTLIAAIDGTIIYKGGSVSIQPSQQITGSIDTTTGNINCLGSLKVHKNICSEFKVVVGGDLEVGGNVEDAAIQAGGNVLVRGGFFGSGKGIIAAGRDVTVKYAENQKIRAGGTVYVGGEVLNCDVYAADAVLVQGRVGRIAGGNVAAKHVVRAANLGNDASVPTHIHVAYDMKLMGRMREVLKELERLDSDEKRVKTALVTLYRLEMAGQLPADKKEILLQFKEFTKLLPSQREALKSEQEQLRHTLQELSGARVIAEETVYAGVVVHFGPVYKEITEDINQGAVFEKTGESITKNMFDSERERRIEEQWRKSRKESEVAKHPEAVAV